MGKPAVPSLAAVLPAGNLPGDRANFVVQGAFAAIGTSAPFYAYGPFNVVIWGSVNTSLTVSAGATTGTVVSGTGLVNGQTVNSTLVPPGTTITVSSTTVTWQLPPGFTLANVLGGTDANALFAPSVLSGTFNIERSFDGGMTWILCGVGGTGTGAQYILSASAIPVSVVVGEAEQGCLYRLNCILYTSGTANYRISGTAAAAVAWAVSSAI